MHFLSLPSLKRFDLDFSAVLALEVKGLEVELYSAVLKLKGFSMMIVAGSHVCRVGVRPRHGV